MIENPATDTVRSEERTAVRVEDLLAGGGEMGALMRSKDWSQTPLGPVENWPQSLQTSVSICLASRFPIVLYWGPEYVVLYNDAYSQILGSKHPWALGQTCRVCWAEIWDTIGPMLDGVLATGEATWSDDLLLMLCRFGYPEECYFSFSFSPIRVECGSMGGVFTAVIETTEKVIGQRRLATLRDLASRAVAVKSERDAWEIAAATLAENPRDVPFALLCKADGTGLQAAGAVGVRSDHPLCAALCQPGTELFAQATSALESGEPVEINLGNLGPLAAGLPCGAWDVAPYTAMLCPIAALGQGSTGLLLAAVSPAKRVDESYRTFYQLLSRQIATSIADARAYEEERKRAEALAELDRAKTAFFSNVSHEFRTPLTLLLGPLEEVSSKFSGCLPSEGREQLRMARRNSLRLLKLVNTLLEFSRIEAGRIEAVYEPTDLGTLTAETASIFRSAVESAGLRFRVELEPLPEPVYVDREMWEKIVLNLLSNAFKFTLEGEICIALRQAGRAVELEVRDTGAGIPAAELPRVFERFHRVENSRSRSYEGTGIGLALVQELVTLHGGQIRVESAVGQGSRFTVSIPLGTEHLPADKIGRREDALSQIATATAHREEAQRWSRPDLQVTAEAMLQEAAVQPPLSPSPDEKERDIILLVDDNADMRDYVKRLLSPQYHVIACAGGDEAVRLAAEIHPVLVLSDIMMPGLSGLQMLEAIRSNPALREVPVILLSARAGEESRLEGLQADADDYLVKPFTARELQARVSMHVRLAKLRREVAARQAQLRIEAEEERGRLQSLLAQAPVGIGLLQGPEHRWNFVNDFYVAMTGRSSAAEFLGKTVGESLPEVAGQGILDLLDQVYRSGKPYSGREMKVALNRAPGGQTTDAFFDFVYQPMRDAGGRVDGILVLAVDLTEQVLARKAIQENEERLRAIIETTPECVKLVAPDGTLRQMNPAGLAVLEADSAEQVIGKSIYDLIAPEDRESYRAFHERVCRGERGSLEFEIVGLRGVRRSMESHAAPLRDSDGAIVQLSVSRDVSDRKRAEEILREREAEFRGLADAMAQLVWMARPDGEIYWFNKRWCEYTGTTVEDHLGRRWQSIHDPAYLPQVLERWNTSMRTGEPFEMTFPLRSADGTFRPFLTRAVPIRDSAGNIVRWFGTNTDIGSEVKIREELERSQERLQTALAASQRLAAIVESSDDAIVSKDLNGIVTSWNPGAERIFGYSAAEMIGQSITTIIPPELLDDEAHILATMARGERIEHFETYRRTKSGNMIEVSLTISPVRDETGKVVGAAKIARDITQRKQTERALHTSDRLASVGRLAATIAHEINNPLEAVTNLVYLARCNAPEGPTRGFLDYAEQELVRVSMLTKQTLGFYRETRGVVTQRLGELLPPLITIFASRAGNKKIAIDTEIRQDPPIQCIPGEIRQLFVNLLNNSIDAMVQEGRIRVRVSAAREWNGKGRAGVRLTIADTGPGIPEAVRRQIFEPFFTTKKDVGTGLGLWVCKGIVSKHGGNLRVRSRTAPGSSFTAFSLFLPEETELAKQAGSAPSVTRAAGALDSSAA